MPVRTIHRHLKCGFKTAAGADEWAAVEHPPLGEFTQCPECGSANARTP